MLKCFDIAGKTAMVTGGSKGLGKVFAGALAKSGANLFLVARNARELEAAAREIEGLGAPCGYMAADITSAGQIEAAVDRCVERFGGIDILVNNAACGRVDLPPEDTSLEQWNAVINTNLTGSFLCAKAVGRQMIRQQSGKIINIASMSGVIVNKGVHTGSYEVSKHGVIGLTRSLAVEWVKHNIQVNALAPGCIMTQLNRDYFDEHPDALRTYVDATPMGRIGFPEELEGAIAFLASPASSFMCGSVVIVDGGYTCW